MSKLLALSLAAPFLLIGAAHPGPDSHPTSASPEAGPLTYRPCRPGPGDDRCIQLYERGVRASYAAWQRHGGARRLAMGGPDEAPPRRVIVRQHAAAHQAPRVIVVPRTHAAPSGHRMAHGSEHGPAPRRERMAHADHAGGHDMRRCNDAPRVHEVPRVREAPRLREAPREEGGARGM